MYKMSSTLRKFSQIPVRTKYLLGILAGAEGPDTTPGDLFGTGGASVIRVTNGTFASIGPVATTVDISDAITATGATATAAFIGLVPGPTSLVGKLFKDLGRQVTVYDAALPGDLHIATYRECQLVSGAAVEGVPEDTPLYGADYYVRVWAADGAGVSVARTG
jgi:hypothetical protein